jgi:hypothetical protein
MIQHHTILIDIVFASYASVGDILNTNPAFFYIQSACKKYRLFPVEPFKFKHNLGNKNASDYTYKIKKART